MEKKIEINGREYNFRATALIPRQYRYKFKRDMLHDLAQLQATLKKTEEGDRFSILDLTIFENVAWLMLKNGGEDVGDSPEEWLDSLDGIFPVYEVLPQILSVWAASIETTAKPKKK